MAYVDELGLLISKLSKGEITKAEFTASKERILNSQSERVYSKDDILDSSIPYLERLQLIRKLLKQGSITVAEFTEYKAKMVGGQNDTSPKLPSNLKELVDDGVLTIEEASELIRYNKKAEDKPKAETLITYEPILDEVKTGSNKKKLYVVGVAAVVFLIFTQMGNVINALVDDNIVERSLTESDQFSFLYGLSDGDKKEVVGEVLLKSIEKAKKEGFTGTMFESARNLVDTNYTAIYEPNASQVDYKNDSMSNKLDLKDFLLITQMEDCVAQTTAPIVFYSSGSSDIGFTCSYTNIDGLFKSVDLKMHAKSDVLYSMTYKEDNADSSIEKEQRFSINW